MENISFPVFLLLLMIPSSREHRDKTAFLWTTQPLLLLSVDSGCDFGLQIFFHEFNLLILIKFMQIPIFCLLSHSKLWSELAKSILCI